MPEPRVRLDQPREDRRLHRPRIDAETFGAYSERLARYFGTARYLAIQTVFVAVWIAVNVIWGLKYHASQKTCHTDEVIKGDHIVQQQTGSCNGGKPFDPYPFILLNLAFSTQAAYAAPLILLAQNRQTDRDRVQSEQDREEARQSKADLDYLAREIASIRVALGEVPTRDFLRTELARIERERDEAREASGEA